MTRTPPRFPSSLLTRSNAMAHMHNEPGRFSHLLREASWIGSLALAVYLVLILLTYSPLDPGWSHATQLSNLHNKGGRVGAWIADLMLYLFGFSAYILVIALARSVICGFRRLSSSLEVDIQPQMFPKTLPWQATLGLGLWLVGALGLEALILSGGKFALPLASGGILGQVLARYSMGLLGSTGTNLLFLVLLAIGLSLFFKFSWLTVAEQVGAAIEWCGLSIVNAWQRRQDRRAGAIAAQVRAEVVVAQQEMLEEHTPIRIEPAVLAIPKSARVQKELQQPLFSEFSDGALPAIGLLDAPPNTQEIVSHETLEFTSRLIEKKLADFGVQVTVLAAQPGPVITRYEIEPAVGVKGSQIVGLARDLARALSLVSIRVVETIPGKNVMGLELPNARRQTVKLSEILGSQIYNEGSSNLTLALGKDIAGKAVVADLARMPHLLVAGTTGSGKSVGINAMILSLLYKADAAQVRLLLIDPKMLEMSVYEGIPHLLAPVVTDMRQASNALNWCVGEMERRYRLMSRLGVRNLASFNQKIIDAEKREEKIPNPFSLTPDNPEPLTIQPMIVVVIDELADLMMVVGKKIEELIARLAQKARAAGIHLILATQRPSVDVITGLIKANIPTRIAFQVSSKIDSRTILDQMGAEALLGQGDMLYLPPGSGLPQRVHGAFVSDDEVHRVVEYLKKDTEPNYIDGILDSTVGGEDGDGVGSVTGMTDIESDPLYDQAVEIVLKNRRASISLVQRHLRIGYNRSARLLEQMEASGLVSAMQSNGNREILSPARVSEE